jgi:hypothetical protein
MDTRNQETFPRISICYIRLQPIVTEFNYAVLEEVKIVAITKIVLKSHGAKWPLEFTGPLES